jgi:TonB family protein
MDEAWMRWQGRVVNGTFPLRRYLGCSNHSGVFLTEIPSRQPPEAALKLVPASPARAESRLARWTVAAVLTHPHLIRILQTGRCELDGLPYLYAVMEYADQTLAQLLTHRALTEDEAREMLLPVLAALTFLHDRKLLHGQVKPTNILAVGEQLKLSSDTILPVGEGSPGSGSASRYDPPEARYGSRTTAGDIWGVGVTLIEALTRVAPPVPDERAESLALPPELPAAFREIVAACLNRRPQDRPTARELEAWVRGGSASAPLAPAAPRRPATAPAGSAAAPEPPRAQAPRPRSSLALLLAAAVILVLGWTGVRLLTTRQSPALATEAAGHARSQPSLTAVPVTPAVPPPAASAPGARAGGTATAPSAVHEEIPDVPRRARQTIHGHIKVWVRVIVAKDGAVFAARADRPGPSRYFERLAIEAARKWSFPAVDAPDQRLMQVRFDFSRGGTTGRAVTLQ